MSIILRANRINPRLNQNNIDMEREIETRLSIGTISEQWIIAELTDHRLDKVTRLIVLFADLHRRSGFNPIRIEHAR